MSDKLSAIFKLIEEEHSFAISHFPPFHSAHEGLAVIEEEYLELRAEVFRHQSQYNSSNMKKEALQVATMAIRFIIDIAEANNE